MIDLGKIKYDIGDLRQIMAQLRSPDGCPWDRAQDHDGIRRYFLEEVYEACDAIDRKDDSDLCEELGDVLLQVVFHSAIAESEGAFTFDDVCDGICRKMILRHPLLFGGAGSTDWEQIKQTRFVNYADAMDHVARALPALTVAEKLSRKAAQAGFSPDSEHALDKLSEKLQALHAAAHNGSDAEAELGDMLFAAASVGLMLDLDPERALQKANDTFRRQFARLETMAGDKLSTMRPDEMLNLWEKAKKEC